MCQRGRVNSPGAQTFNSQLCVRRCAKSWESQLPAAGKFLRHTRVVETHVAWESEGPP